jgi:sulfur-carrier protein adenylyltransferase/sulfurtransferase
MLYDALNMKFRELKLNPNPDRPVIDKLIDYDEFCGVTQANAEEAAAKASMAEMTVTELKKLIDSGATDYLLLDVRNPHEFDIGKIPGGVLVPLPDIENSNGIDQVKQLLGDKKLIVHCKAGGRSAKAIAILKEKAGIQGTNVIGGILAWSKEVDPSVPEY